MRKINWSILWGVLVTIIFLVLLAIRLEFFSKTPGTVQTVTEATPQKPSDTWMNIYQKNNKIGFVHRTFAVMDKGFHYNETIIMQINTMGITQALHIDTEGDLNPDMTVSSFNFDLNSSLFRFNVHGFVVKNRLILYIGTPGSQQKSEIPIQAIPHMSGSIYDAAFRANLEKDTIGNFSIFDPATLGLRSIKVTRNANEIIPVMGKLILTQKYCADFMGAKNCAWLDRTGDVLKETSILGLSMEKVSPQKAQEGINRDDSIDFTEVASLPANIKIDEPSNLDEIKIRISGIRGLLLFLNGGRQSLYRDILTIKREHLPVMPLSGNNPPKEMIKYLQASPLVQADDPQIKAQVDKIVRISDSPEQKTRKIVNWVYHNIKKEPVLSVPNAVEVLKNKVGDCNEHAVLVAALLRAAGIPAQIETGLVYLQIGRATRLNSSH